VCGKAVALLLRLDPDSNPLYLFGTCSAKRVARRAPMRVYRRSQANLSNRKKLPGLAGALLDGAGNDEIIVSSDTYGRIAGD
jgi:hypothetical protein